MHAKLITGLIAGLFAVGIANAQPASSSASAKSSPMARADKNADGFISREEAAGHPMLEKHFDMIDTDKDGKLSQAELQAARQAMQDRRKQALEAKFKAADTDGDGALSRAEAEKALQPRIGKMFETADANKDGKVTREELQAAHKGPSGAHRDKADKHFKAADKNGDGAVSREEADAASKLHLAQWFDKLDTNKDGKLTLEELKTGKESHHMHGAQSAK